MKEDLKKMIDKEKFQVFIMCCPAYFPFNFFRHPWIVLNRKGEIYRYEIRHSINIVDQTHFFINNQPPFEGINKTILIKNKRDAELLKYLEGDTAQRIIDFVEKTENGYPYIKEYYFNGPNSNTYLSWILKNFPEIDLKLSWRFIGKNYKL